MGSGPAAPDPKKTSDAQTDSNIKTAIAQQNLGMVNQKTPFGNLTYSQTGKNPDGTPIYQASTTLTPQLQNILNTQFGNQLQMGNMANAAGKQASTDLGRSTPMPTYQNFSNMNSAGFMNDIQGAGNIANSYNNGGNITRSIANAGNIQKSLGTNDYSADRQRVEDALMGRLNNQYGQDLTSLQQRLANQGVKEGSEAYSNAMRDYSQGVAEGRTSAILGAGQEQNRLQQLALNAGNFANSAQAQQYGQNANNAQFANSAQAQANAQNMAAAQFGNQAQAQKYSQNANNAQFRNTALQQQFENRNTTTAANNQLQQQKFQDQSSLKNQSLNNYLALMSGQQVGMPQFQGTPQSGVAPTDVTGNVWNAYNAQQNQHNQFWNGVGALGSAVGGFLFSDERLKEDKKRVGATDDGTPIYTYRYKGSPMMQMGVMAQDVKKKQPEAVRKGPGGFLQVNYRRVS